MRKEAGWLLREKYRNKPNKNFLSDVRRLKTGEPVDYVIGFTEFLGCKIDLSKKRLIPRPETEFWVQRAIKDILTYSSLSGCCDYGSARVLDIFAGSGCIGLAVLRHIKNAEVVFADKDKKCIDQIKINLKLNNSLIRTNRGIVVRSDIFSNLRHQKFDYIFANPPYVARKNIKKVQQSVLKYEPHNALFGGQDGLFYIKKFLRQALKHLNSGGMIFMEFSPEQKKEIEKLLTRLRVKLRRGEEKFSYKTWQFHKDQYGKLRYVMIEYNKI